MELLQEITEKDLGLSQETISRTIKYQIRRAARAVVIDNEKKIALVWSGYTKHHKIPGGGIEDGEDILAGLKREIREEAGVEAEIAGEVGMTMEYKNKDEELQFSYCYLARVNGKKSAPQFTSEEIERGFRLEWVTLDEALKLFANDQPEGYWGRFMWRRDFDFLLKAKEILNNN